MSLSDKKVSPSSLQSKVSKLSDSMAVRAKEFNALVDAVQEELDSKAPGTLELKSKTIRVSAAQILSGAGNNFDIAVPGKAILPVAGMWKYTHVTTSYSASTKLSINKV